MQCISWRRLQSRTPQRPAQDTFDRVSVRLLRASKTLSKAAFWTHHFGTPRILFAEQSWVLPTMLVTNSATVNVTYVASHKHQMSDTFPELQKTHEWGLLQNVCDPLQLHCPWAICCTSTFGGLIFDACAMQWKIGRLIGLMDNIKHVFTFPWNTVSITDVDRSKDMNQILTRPRLKWVKHTCQQRPPNKNKKNFRALS